MSNTVLAADTGLPLATRRNALVALAGLGATAGLAGLAALPATAVPAFALPVIAQVDPTFALIERHSAAYQAFNDALRSPDLGDAPIED